MTGISDPTQIDHPLLREFAVQAAWVAKLEDAVGVLEELVVDLVDANFNAAEQELEARVTEWLAQDPEHWPIFRLVVLDPWQEQPGEWREDVPGWGRSLGTNTTLAHFQQDPNGRQRVLDWNANMEPDNVT
jgi:hypothetical protein